MAIRNLDFSLSIVIVSMALWLIFSPGFAQFSGSGSPPQTSGVASPSGGPPGSADKEDCTIGNGNIISTPPTAVNPQNDYSLTNNQLKRPTTICPAETRFVRP